MAEAPVPLPEAVLVLIGATAVVNFLEGTQGRHVSNALADGFEAPETALQAEPRMTAVRAGLFLKIIGPRALATKSPAVEPGSLEIRINLSPFERALETQFNRLRRFRQCKKIRRN